ncbi:MAG: putative methyltransferase [Chlamydiia bacterium]|nr:putative methyltransferase [Chlamydiia bacterium]
MNAVPDDAQEAIELMMRGVSQERLSAFATKLSDFYRQKVPNLPPLKTFEEHLAYLCFRLPATYAALLEVFSRVPGSPQTMLDLGAGPGTAFLAATTQFETKIKATLVERDPIFIDMGKKIIPDPTVTWLQADLNSFETAEKFDLVTISYALGELPTQLFGKVVEFALARTKGHLVIVEPGTPRGYETIITARRILLEKGASCVAPCPHNRSCPIQAGDWCHFATRLPRSRLHRNIKGATLGFEDEKFSYIVMTPETIFQEPYDRIIRAPLHRSGHVHTTLCTYDATIEQKTISRRDKDLFAFAKKAEWGDTLPCILLE